MARFMFKRFPLPQMEECAPSSRHLEFSSVPAEGSVSGPKVWPSSLTRLNWAGLEYEMLQELLAGMVSKNIWALAIFPKPPCSKNWNTKFCARPLPVLGVTDTLDGIKALWPHCVTFMFAD